jgi:hypothetical protein
VTVKYRYGHRADPRPNTWLPFSRRRSALCDHCDRIIRMDRRAWVHVPVRCGS